MEATLFSTFLNVQLFMNDNRCAFINQIEYLNHICISHSDAAVAVGSADRLFMFRAVNVNETITSVGIVLFDSIEPQNPRCDEILCRRQRIVRTKRSARLKNGSWFGP